MRDLGILVASDLKPSKHVTEIVRRASIKSCLIHRAFTTRSRVFLLDMYSIFVRPLLESNTSLWSPYLVSDITLVERVQRRYTKRFPGLQENSYTERLQILGLESLEHRRLKFDLVNVFKILHGFIPVEIGKYFKFGCAITEATNLNCLCLTNV